MDAEAPKCPTCGAPVQPDWDWCNLCGYDPDSLKPPGWIPSDAVAAEPTKGRRRKREAAAAGDTKTRTRTKTGTKTRARTNGAGSIVTPIAPLVSPRIDPDREVAPSSIPPIVPMAQPARPSPASTEQVFRVAPSSLERGAAIVMMAAAAGLAYLAVRGIIQVADGASTSTLDNVSTVFFIVVCAVLTFGLVAQGMALLRQKVVLTPTEVIVHNRFGRVQRAPRNEVHGLRMGQRSYMTPRGLSRPLDVPYLQFRDGSGFWLDALGARSPISPPTDDQLAQFDQLQAAVAVDRTSGVS